MKLLVLSVLLVICALGESCSNSGFGCKDSLQCCSSYCRFGTCANYGDDPENEQRYNPCWTVKCRSGYTCVLKKVQCVKAPCEPVARCVKNPNA